MIRFRPSPARFGLLVVASILATAPAVLAQQAVEVTPFGGYRFGGDFFELMTGQRLDVDGAPAYGITVDVPTHQQTQFEALFTHQDAQVYAPQYPYGPPIRWNMTVEHYQAGGLYEFDPGAVRPFLTGSLGLTRYAAAGDNEVRFSLGMGGGVKLFPSERFGIRLGTQIYSTFVDADGTGFACTPGFCAIAFHANVLWQIEFTAGAVIRFP